MAHAIGFPAIQFPQRRMSAAALSAAVDSTHKQEPAPTSHGRASSKKRTSLFPSTLRERGGLGGEALLLEKRPLPPAFLPHVSSGGGPGEGLLYREAASPGVLPLYFFVLLLVFA